MRFPITVHVRNNSPKRPWAALSFYLQRSRVGVTWRWRDSAKGGVLHKSASGRWRLVLLGRPVVELRMTVVDLFTPAVNLILAHIDEIRAR